MSLAVMRTASSEEQQNPPQAVVCLASTKPQRATAMFRLHDLWWMVLSAVESLCSQYTRCGMLSEWLSLDVLQVP